MYRCIYIYTHNISKQFCIHVFVRLSIRKSNSPRKHLQETRNSQAPQRRSGLEVAGFASLASPHGPEPPWSREARVGSLSTYLSIQERQVLYIGYVCMYLDILNIYIYICRCIYWDPTWRSGVTVIDTKSGLSVVTSTFRVLSKSTYNLLTSPGPPSRRSKCPKFDPEGPEGSKTTSMVSGWDNTKWAH